MKNVLKASLVSSLTLGLFFFFGAIHDLIKGVPHFPFLSKYSVLVPLLFLIYCFAFLQIKKKPGVKLATYLNLLFVILVMVDCKIIIDKIVSHKTEALTITACENCEKPDVYFILLDGYAGRHQLMKEFSFSNETFLLHLKQIGFHVIDSSFSNYSDTPFSMSSVLNMKYLELTNYSYSEENLNYCYELIADNKVVKIFKKLGYRFINNSIFDIQEQPASINKTFLISGVQLITSQTFWGRFRRDVYNNIIDKHFPNSSLNKNIVFADLNNNKGIYHRTVEAAKEKSNVPRFIYSHLLMPHFPYYYDSLGKLNSFRFLAPNNLYNDNLYLSYLKYCNSYVSNLLQLILNHSSKPPIILLLSDHGYRRPVNHYGPYSNLAAIYLPDRNYSVYPNNLSNINQFTILFNSIFQQRFPMHNNETIQ